MQGEALAMAWKERRDEVAPAEPQGEQS
jgi:hypothetical protein